MRTKEIQTSTTRQIVRACGNHGVAVGPGGGATRPGRDIQPRSDFVFKVHDGQIIDLGKIINPAQLRINIFDQTWSPFPA